MPSGEVRTTKEMGPSKKKLRYALVSVIFLVMLAIQGCGVRSMTGSCSDGASSFQGQGSGVQGIVMNTQGAPLSGSQVSLNYSIRDSTSAGVEKARRDGRAILTVVTGADGKYFFTGVAPGNYMVSASHQDYLPRTDPVTVASGIVTEHDIVLQWKMNMTDTRFDDIWGSGPGDVFAVGYDSRIAHYNGTSWAYMYAGASQTLHCVWGSGPRDVYAGGEGVILHYDGSAWTAVSFASSFICTRIWGSSADNIYAIGSEGTSGQIYHFDGTSWAPEAIPAADYLYDIWGSGPGDIYAVGSVGTVLHYDGAQWTSLSIASNDSGLLAIWGSAPGDIFIGGSLGILHYNGNSWSSMAGLPDATWYGMWGSGPHDVYAGGGGSDDGRLIHYDGKSWSTVSWSESPFCRIWGSGNSDIFVVSERAITHYDGFSWTTSLSGGTGQELSCLEGSSASHIFCGGRNGILMSFNGTSWENVSTPQDPLIVSSMWVTGPDYAVAAGFGVILRYTGSFWEKMESPSSGYLYDIWASGQDNVYAVNYESIQHFDGIAWSSVNIPGYQATGIWGRAPDDIFSVGADGTVIHFNGSQWEPMDYSTEPLKKARLRGVWGFTTSKDTYAVGENGMILHYNGAGWSVMESGTKSYLWDLWGSDPDNLFAVGDSGTILHYHGGSWNTMQSGTSIYLRNVWGSAPDDVYASSSAIVLHYDGIQWTEVKELGGGVIMGSSMTDIHHLDIAQNEWFHYDGATWKPVVSGNLDFMEEDINDIWGNGKGEFYFVGKFGKVLRYDGATWTHIQKGTAMQTGTFNTLSGVWGTGTGELYAVGEKGTVVKCDGRSWTAMTGIPTSGDLNKVWGSGPDDIYAAGTEAVLHYTGGAWNKLGLTGGEYYDVWGTGPGDVFITGKATGGGGIILHYNGASWITMEHPFTTGTVSFKSIWGSGSQDVFVVGGGDLDSQGGVILHYDGSVWTSMIGDTGLIFNAVWGISAHSVYAAGNHGTIYQYVKP